MTNGEEETRSLWQLSCLCSELRICLRQNQNKEKKLLLKKLHHKHLLLMLYQSKNFRELSQTVSNSYNDLQKQLQRGVPWK